MPDFTHTFRFAPGDQVTTAAEARRYAEGWQPRIGRIAHCRVYLTDNKQLNADYNVRFGVDDFQWTADGDLVPYSAPKQQAAELNAPLVLTGAELSRS